MAKKKIKEEKVTEEKRPKEEGGGHDSTEYGVEEERRGDTWNA